MSGCVPVANSWLNGGGTKDPVDVHAVVDEQGCKGLLDMIAAGALVSLGTTRDGGTLAITVTVDGEWRREYVRTLDELRVYLAEAVPAVEDLCAGLRPSAAPAQRPRRRKAS